MSDLRQQIQAAGAAGNLLDSSVRNLLQTLERGADAITEASISELCAGAYWDELNDRFFRTLAFGTGGLRGRTIGKHVTAAELGKPQPLGRPEHACVGTNAMNGFNVSRATQGLIGYVQEWLAEQGLNVRPRLAIAYDTRHFSQQFAELAARVATDLGADVCLFQAPRSTPHLSFAVRDRRAHAGVVITASHNPPHDNGYKVYFGDVAQVVEPHASAIIKRVNAIESEVTAAPASEGQGTIEWLGAEMDKAYLDRLETLVLDRDLISRAAALKVVFTPIHGVGGAIIPPLFQRLGINFTTVAEQDAADSRFPTVKSPNPENAEALALAIAQAQGEGAAVVIATDPDCDRMGVAVRDREGKMQLLTGNQIGSLMAWYRLDKLTELGIITSENAARCVVIKTLVTTDLQKALASAYGARCVETLTGFKYIGEKLGNYEAALAPEIRARYRTLPEAETRAARLERSSYYVCGGEESYGYSAADFVRDKDGNGAAAVFAEVAACAEARGLSVLELLDEVYCRHGFYLEKNGSLSFEGAEGALTIARLVASYARNPPGEISGLAVEGTRNFASDTFHDVEGCPLPQENMLIFDLAGGNRIAVRPSGTEPKIKFYLFARKAPRQPMWGAEELREIKAEVGATLETLWSWVQADVKSRLSN